VAGFSFTERSSCCIVPLALAKITPLFQAGRQIGFLGVSYVTFRALDVIFCLRDNVITLPRFFDFVGFLFFFPTICPTNRSLPPFCRRLE
jgi:membrane protein involved in D-alanine export